MANVLVVDDNRHVRVTLDAVLRSEGHAVELASGIEDGLQMLREKSFDVVISDILLGHGTGLDVLREVRNLAPRIKVVMITGQPTVETAAESVRQGAFDYLFKPISREAIAQVVGRAAEMKELEDETAMLQEQNLTYQRFLEAANSDLEAFSYSIAHDLRAPLRAVQGFSCMLLEDHAPDLSMEARRHLGTMRSTAETMSAMIDSLLTFARLDRMTLTKTAFDTDALVRQILRDLQGEHEGRTVTIEVHSLPESLADRDLLKHVWTTLISNALKFTRQRPEARIELGTSQRDGAEPFYVRDNGIGFDPSQGDGLFRIFHRLHADPRYEGTGASLAIAHRIVQRHGGRLWAEAEPDRGTTFYFYLAREAGSEA